jgi:hypothetical protein
VWPLVLSGVLGYMVGRGRPDVVSAIGYAGLATVEDASGLPISLLGLQNASVDGLARGAALSLAYGRLGFWGAAGAHLAYGLGTLVRGDIR